MFACATLPGPVANASPLSHCPRHTYTSSAPKPYQKSFATMSWMDFKTAQALKAQKVNEDSRRQRLGSVQKGTSAASSVGYDSLSVQKAVSAPKKKAEAIGRLPNAGDAANVATEVVRHSDPVAASGDQSCERYAHPHPKPQPPRHSRRTRTARQQACLC